jgi:hypothetical protein
MHLIFCVPCLSPACHPTGWSWTNRLDGLCTMGAPALWDTSLLQILDRCYAPSCAEQRLTSPRKSRIIEDEETSGEDDYGVDAELDWRLQPEQWEHATITSVHLSPFIALAGSVNNVAVWCAS